MRLGYLKTTLFAVIAISIVAISALIIPESLGSLGFWLNVGWIVILAGLNWLIALYIFRLITKKQKSSIYGALSSISIIVFIYSLVSAVLLITSWSINNYTNHASWHLISQISAFSITAVICILILISARGANIAGIDHLPSKDELNRRISLLINETQVSNKAQLRCLKELDEIIRYSIPHLANLNSEDNYLQLYSEIKTLNISEYSTEEFKEKVIFLTGLARSC